MNLQLPYYDIASTSSNIASLWLSYLKSMIHYIATEYIQSFYTQLFIPISYLVKPAALYATHTVSGALLYQQTQMDALMTTAYHLQSFVNIYYPLVDSPLYAMIAPSTMHHPHNISKPLLLISGELDHVQSSISLYKTYTLFHNSSFVSTYVVPHATHNLLAFHTETFITAMQSFSAHHLAADTRTQQTHKKQDRTDGQLALPPAATMRWPPPAHIPASVY